MFGIAFCLTDAVTSGVALVSLGHGDGEVWAGGVLLMGDGLELLHDVGVLGGYVVILMEVGGKVVEAACPAPADEFPISLAYSYLVGFVKFPVEVVVDGLLLAFASQGGQE